MNRQAQLYLCSSCGSREMLQIVSKRKVSKKYQKAGIDALCYIDVKTIIVK